MVKWKVFKVKAWTTLCKVEERPTKWKTTKKKSRAKSIVEIWEKSNKRRKTFLPSFSPTHQPYTKRLEALCARREQNRENSEFNGVEEEALNATQTTWLILQTHWSTGDVQKEKCSLESVYLQAFCERLTAVHMQIIAGTKKLHFHSLSESCAQGQTVLSVFLYC